MTQIWLNSGLPKEICDKNPELNSYGFYRKLNDGKYELLSYCNANSERYLSMHEEKFKEILDATLPEDK